MMPNFGPYNLRDLNTTGISIVPIAVVSCAFWVPSFIDGASCKSLALVFSCEFWCSAGVLEAFSFFQQK